MFSVLFDQLAVDFDRDLDPHDDLRVHEKKQGSSSHLPEDTQRLRTAILAGAT